MKFRERNDFIFRVTNIYFNLIFFRNFVENRARFV